MRACYKSVFQWFWEQTLCLESSCMHISLCNMCQSTSGSFERNHGRRGKCGYCHIACCYCLRLVMCVCSCVIMVMKKYCVCVCVCMCVCESEPTRQLSRPCPVCQSVFEFLQFQQVNTCFVFFPHIYPLSSAIPFFPRQAEWTEACEGRGCGGMDL